jgi:hypothetical protein
MKQLSNHEEFILELHKERVISPEKIKTKGYGQLQFECGCGEFHGVNDYEVEIVATYMPVKILFKCSSNYTKVHIKGFFKQKCLSLWTIKTDLVQDLKKDLNF